MANIKKLTLLHSNDLHGDFLAEQIDDKLVGGVSMLSGYINEVRKNEKNVIYAIAGDMFRGSVIDSEYKGLSTIEIMNALAPDVVTIGNHEVDYGFAHLLFIEKCAKFPIINANLHIKTNNARLFTPYYIIEIDGMKILFIGIITEEVLDSAKTEGLIGTFINTEEAAVEVGRICNAHHSIDIDFTVLLTHIGWEEDHRLASMLDPEWGVDVIIGGHSHTFIDQPDVVNNILIAQAGIGTDGIGRFDIDINTDTNSVENYTWSFVPINDQTCPRDEQLEELISSYKGMTDQKYGRILCKFPKVLTHPSRIQETELGNLFADILKEGLGVDVALFGSGSIRLDKLGPLLTLGKLTECCPYTEKEKEYMFKVTKDDLRHMLKYMCRDEAWTGHTEFYQVSKGIEFIYSKSKQDFIKCLYNGEDLAGDDILTIALSEFHMLNVEKFLDISEGKIDELGKPRVIATKTFDVLSEYFEEHNMTDANIEKRMVIMD